MVKRAITLYLNREVVKKLKRRGISISNIVDSFLRKVADESLTASEYAAELSPYYEEREKLADEIDTLEKQLVRLKKRLSILDEKISKGEAYVKEAERAKQAAMLFREMNQVIVSCEFKTELAWELCKGIVQQLASLNHEIAFDWFKKHVERLKVWLA